MCLFLSMVIQILFLIAGLLNTVGLLVFNGFFTNKTLTKESLFAVESQILIHLWGFLYIAASTKWDTLPWITLIFSVEKVAFFIFWCLYIGSHENTGNLLTDTFYTIYGPVDLAFGIVFAYASFVAFQKEATIS